MTKQSNFIYLLLLCFSTLSAQHNYNWVFDSLLVRFDANGVVSTGTSMGGQVCTETSWSDGGGDPVFYSRGWPVSGLYDAGHQLISNSLNFNYSQQYDGIVFLPFEGTDRFAIVSKDPFTDTTLIGGCAVWYHIYDQSTNTLIHKNEALLPLGSGLKMAVAATRHANGRDWWVINHEATGKKFYISLVTPDGFSSPVIQSIGSKHGLDNSTGGGGYGGSLLFTSAGDKLIALSLEGIIEEFSFDRCTGLLSFVRTIHPALTGFADFTRTQYFAALSPDGNILYVSNSDLDNSRCQIEQYDLTAVDVLGSKYEVLNLDINYGCGAIQAGPDGRMYFMVGYAGNGTPLYDALHIQVIHQPDIMGSGCQFQANGVSLPVVGTLHGYTLPYFINYNLKALPNSTCDTLGVGYSTESAAMPQLIRAYPNPGNEYCIIELPDYFTESIDLIKARDLLGKEIFPEYRISDSAIVNIDTRNLSPGLYTIEVHSGKNILNVFWRRE